MVTSSSILLGDPQLSQMSPDIQAYLPHLVALILMILHLLLNPWYLKIAHVS